jgi:hypothetical protein
MHPCEHSFLSELQANIISKELHKERSYREPERKIFESPVLSCIPESGNVSGFLMDFDVEKGVL